MGDPANRGPTLVAGSRPLGERVTIRGVTDRQMLARPIKVNRQRLAEVGFPAVRLLRQDRNRKTHRQIRTE